MGYLQIAGSEFGGSVPDFSKAVFSFWFKYPASAASAAIAQYAEQSAIFDATSFYTNNLLGMIPLVAWGANPVISTGDGSSALSPSFIGISCGCQSGMGSAGDFPESPPGLVARFQYDFGTNDVTIGTEPPYTMPEFFQIGYRHFGPHMFAGFGAPDPQIMPAQPDKWHHVLLSMDLSQSCSSSMSGGGGDLDVLSCGSSVKLYIGLDDHNYNDAYFWPSNVSNYGGSGGSNDIMSSTCLTIGDSFQDSVPTSASFGGAALSASAHDFGIPCTGDTSSFNYGGIDMAEFQLYTDVTLDTSDVLNRRLFVTEDGKPASQSLVPPVLGKAADIYLGGRSQNWINGLNAGTAGNFTPVGTIKEYVTGPSL